MMGDAGKRNRPYKDREDEGRSQKRRISEKDELGNNELVVYRILCPGNVIGSVIGKSGKVINGIRQESRAKVKVVDAIPGASDRVITIYCQVKEKVAFEIDDDFDEIKLLCSAQDALLRVHAAIAGAVEAIEESDKRRKEVQCHILVPSSQSANIIGKGGSTIKRLRSKTKASIKVTPKDASDLTHSCAMDFDNFVMISGESDAVKKALHAISAIMYKFGPKEEIPLEITILEPGTGVAVPSDVPLYQPSGLYQNADPILPSRSFHPLFNATHTPDLSSFPDAGNTWPVYSSTQFPIPPGIGSNTQCEELKLKLLCPHDKIGRVIGKGGMTIKSIRQISGARIDVDDCMVHHNDCVITINSAESLDDSKSMALDAVLLLQEKINDESDAVITIRLFILSKMIGCIIGKSGSIISEIRKSSKAGIRISKNVKSKSGDSNDELVEISGEVSNVRDALVQIILRLRDDALRAKDGIQMPQTDPDSLYFRGPGLSIPSLLPSLSPIASLGYDQRIESGNGLSLLASGPLCGYGSLSVPETSYGSVSAYPTSKLYGGLNKLSTIEMLVPSHAVGKVLGKGGSNIINIRKISGATVELADPKFPKGDRIALIGGTPEQIRAAENLIQAFIMAT